MAPGSGMTVARGCGVWGDFNNGYGVFGTSNGRYGVYGESTNSGGFGVSGVNNSAWPSIAIYGDSGFGHGVKGVNRRRQRMISRRRMRRLG